MLSAEEWDMLALTAIEQKLQQGQLLSAEDEARLLLHSAEQKLSRGQLVTDAELPALEAAPPDARQPQRAPSPPAADEPLVMTVAVEATVFEPRPPPPDASRGVESRFWRDGVTAE